MAYAENRDDVHPRTARHKARKPGLLHRAGAVPEAARSTVAQAALAMIRDELKAKREQAKATAAKAKARKLPATKRVARPEALTTEAAATASPPKRRPRKPAEIPASS